MANKENQPKVKNLKISEETHLTLKKYCQKKRIKDVCFCRTINKRTL